MRGCLALLAACGFSSSVSTPPLDTPPIDSSIDALADAMIDAPPDGPRVCSTAGLVCPAGSLPRLIGNCGMSGVCWVGCRDGGSFTPAQATAACVAWGGRLTPIYSAAEETCVRTMINGAIWLGLEQPITASTPSSDWRWAGDSTVPTYFDWGNGQPSDGDGTEDGTEQCAYSNSSGEWHDEPCTTVLPRMACRYP